MEQSLGRVVRSNGRKKRVRIPQLCPHLISAVAKAKNMRRACVRLDIKVVLQGWYRLLRDETVPVRFDLMESESNVFRPTKIPKRNLTVIPDPCPRHEIALSVFRAKSGRMLLKI